MSAFVTYDRPFASMYAAVRGQPQDLLKYAPLADLVAKREFLYSELGGLRLQPDTLDRAVLESCFQAEICDLETEIGRRTFGGQDLGAARRESARYPPDLIRFVKQSFDLRDIVSRDIGLTKPLIGNIRSPFRADDHTPSFRVYADHYFDFGSREYGDVFDWRMRFHGVPFWQALESLAVEAGISIFDVD
jgi:hypothetical protein